MKNITTPRTLSDAQFQTGYPSIFRTRQSHSGWWKWSGWIAFGLLLLAQSGRS